MDWATALQSWQWLKAHPWVGGVIILVGAAIVGKIVDQIFTRLVKRLTSKTKTDLDDKVSEILPRPIQFTVILFSLLLVIRLLVKDASWEELSVNLVHSVLILMWAMTLIRISRAVFKTFYQHHRGQDGISQVFPLFENMAQVVLIVLGTWGLLTIWEVDVTPLMASAGIATAAIALASKDTLANFFGGMSIFVDRPFNLGDYIIMDSGERGEVVDIGVRSTRVITRDDVLITVPNGVMANAKIINQSGAVKRFRVRAKVQVAYDSDIDQVEEVLLGAVEGVENVLPRPTPRVRFRSFGDSGLDFNLLCWVLEPSFQGKVLHQINRNIFKKFSAAGIEIPFPQSVVHLAPQPAERKVECAGQGVGRPDQR